ncbi:hypothetical protein KPL71_020007 [Citrus sinensis]|uniref:Uncharacterized protein n=1 Tax=Citrus sinensis TaxID=2711 RepID=A0ACB8J4F2_CITSI|nr:hypothetical protein KPL71_020007 [Citrus sinensis]
MAADLPWRCICIHGQRSYNLFIELWKSLRLLFSHFDTCFQGCPNHLLIKYQQVTNAMVCLLIFPQLMLIMTNHEVSYEAAGNELGHEPPLNLKGYDLGNPITDSQFDDNSKIPFVHPMAIISDELYEEDQDNEPADKLDEDFDVALINPDDYLRSSASNNDHDNDDDEGDVTECGPEKLTRAQRKRLRKKKLKEDARRRGNIIGPLLPTTSDGDNNGRGGGGEINSPDVRQNADEKCATPSVESEFSGCCNQKKLKHRRVAKRLAREQLKLSSSVPENNRG